VIDLRQSALTADDYIEQGAHEGDGEQQLTNEELLKKIQNNDLPYDAFSQLVRNNSKRFYILAYRLLGNREDAEDIVQNCFMRIWHASDLFDESKGAKFTTWFTRVVINECRMNFRKSARNAAKPDEFADYAEQEEILNESASATDEIVEGLAEKQKADLVKDAIDQLPDRQREALVLCFYEGISNKEAADIMDINVKALESLLMRAKKQLKELFHNERD
jgi:RNA polymerase sigma-70 factor (ECF subfamily)